METIHPCRHVKGKMTRVQVLQEELIKRQNIYEAARDGFERAKKKLKQEKEEGLLL